MRTKAAYWCCLPRVAVTFPDAEWIGFVQDNLNPHPAGALYASFPRPKPWRWPSAARSITPTNGTWLNRAALELSALTRRFSPGACPPWSC